jgi:hypothetical protein
VKADRPPEEAQANVAYLKRLLAANANARAEAGRPPAMTARHPD